MRIPVFVVFAAALAFIFAPIPAVYSQETFDFTIPGPPERSLAPEEPEEVPRQFRELSLGMSLDDLKAALIEDTLFTFRGDRDVSFLPLREETLVETTGLSFIRRAFFQLSEGNVFIMAFTLDTRLVDHYSVYTALVRRYGEPQSLNPQEAVWESEETRLSIERPLTVKYLDKTIFNAIIEESATRESDMLFRREEFLGDF
jgi:hypothetical protein